MLTSYLKAKVKTKLQVYYILPELWVLQPLANLKRAQKKLGICCRKNFFVHFSSNSTNVKKVEGEFIFQNLSIFWCLFFNAVYNILFCISLYIKNFFKVFLVLGYIWQTSVNILANFLGKLESIMTVCF